ncbi:hypothetical protein [Pseudomonas sp. S37]|uniref:hypothetical protein n=1 Tax=Pseudomonas sp. S37 TaxID=2767449 RepID=UPI0019121A29|nr:hypothetical protein [Pseudomonas sp. S37]
MHFSIVLDERRGEWIMAVGLEDVPGLALRPKRPRLLLWASFLLVLMLVGLLFDFLFANYWGRRENLWAVFGVSFLIWLTSVCVRGLTYINQVRLADGWDDARAQDLRLRYQKGRRSLQVLEARMCTAFSPQGAIDEQRMAGLMSGEKVIRTQPFRLDGAPVRHSRLQSDGDADPESVLIEALTVVLCDLARTLSKMPDDLVLNFLLESDSELEEGRLRRIWQYVWRQSGIRQSLVAIDDSGLGVVDKWLDQDCGQNAILLVVAFQFLPEQPKGTAEVVTGLLLGGSEAPRYHTPIAFIHRPELIRGPSCEASDCALQALGWVPIEASSVEHVWRVGVDVHLSSLVAMMIAGARLPDSVGKNMHDLDLLLGHAGNVAPWLVITIVTQAIQAGAGAQFVVSGEVFSRSDIWVFVVTPASPLFH